MIQVIRRGSKIDKVNSWGDAWANMQARRIKAGEFAVTHNGLMYMGDYYAIRQFCRTADLFTVEKAAAELHFKTVGLKLVSNG